MAAASTTPRSGPGTPQPQTSSSTLSHPAHALLARAHSPASAVRIFTDKIQHRPLLLKPTAESDKRALRRHVRLRRKQYYLNHQKPKPLSAKEKRETGVHRLKKDEVRYDVYQGLHQLWNGYMLEILGFTDSEGTLRPGWEAKRVTSEGAGSLLASADFHGAELEVVRCKDAGRIGVKGVVVRDTKYTFLLVTAKDEARTVPKKGTVFRYAVVVVMADGEEKRRLQFEAHGTQIQLRPADRANRKFKWRNGQDYV